MLVVVLLAMSPAPYAQSLVGYDDINSFGLPLKEVRPLA